MQNKNNTMVIMVTALRASSERNNSYNMISTIIKTVVIILEILVMGIHFQTLI